MTKKTNSAAEASLEPLALKYVGPLIYANVPARDLTPEEVLSIPIPAARLIAGGSYVAVSTTPEGDN